MSTENTYGGQLQTPRPEIQPPNERPLGQYARAPPMSPQDGLGGQYQGPARNAQEAMQRLELTKEEIEISRQCQSDSFWQRALPFSLTLGGSVSLAGRWGILNHSAGKVFAAGLVGFALGKLSYIGACEDKYLRHLPKSNVSQMIRQRRGIRQPEFELQQVIIVELVIARPH